MGLSQKATRQQAQIKALFLDDTCFTGEPCVSSLIPKATNYHD